MRIVLLTVAACALACSDESADDVCNPDGTPGWLSDARIVVTGVGVTNDDCRTDVCPHNENTDLVRYRGDIYLVHRTALSQILGPNSSLRFLRSDDEGRAPRSTMWPPTPRSRPSSSRFLRERCWA